MRGATAVETGAPVRAVVPNGGSARRSGCARGRPAKWSWARDVLLYLTAPSAATGTVLAFAGLRLPVHPGPSPSTGWWGPPELGCCACAIGALPPGSPGRQHLDGALGEMRWLTARLAAWLEGSEKNNREHELARAGDYGAGAVVLGGHAPGALRPSLPNVLYHAM